MQPLMVTIMNLNFSLLLIAIGTWCIYCHALAVSDSVTAMACIYVCNR